MQIPFVNAVLSASAAARLGSNSSSHGGDSDADESLCPMVKPPDMSKVSVRKAVAVGTALLTLAVPSSARYAAHTAISGSGAPAIEFATVSKLMNDAIAGERLPGGVVVIGHGGRIVFHRAYGSRKLAGEAGLDGSPA